MELATRWHLMPHPPLIHTISWLPNQPCASSSLGITMTTPPEGQRVYVFRKDHEKGLGEKRCLSASTKYKNRWGMEGFLAYFPCLKPKKGRGNGRVRRPLSFFWFCDGLGFGVTLSMPWFLVWVLFFRFFDFIPVNCGWRQGLIMLIGWWQTVEFWPVAMVRSLTGFYFPKISSWSASMVLGNLTSNFNSKFHRHFLWNWFPVGWLWRFGRF